MIRLLKKIACALLLAMPTTLFAQKYVGGDISLLPTYEAHGVRYLDRGGNQVQPLDYWADSARWNAMRVRLFVDPSKAGSEDQGEGVWQDLNYVTSLAKRIKDKGYALMLDFHYSDTWTDPGQHSTPASWTSSNATVLADSVYGYTKRCLQHLVANGATPDFIQVGNEVNVGMMWPTGQCYADGSNYGSGTWANFASYLNAGAKACREVCSNAKIVLHVAMNRAPYQQVSFYNTASTYNVDYDIIGLSYYPDYHGTISTLSSTLTQLESQHADKEIMIVETGYGAQWALSGTYTSTLQATYLNTIAGQKHITDDIITELNKHSKVTGLFWWLPEDNEYWTSGGQARSSWWNASLYIQSTGRPTDAMFELQRFIGLDPAGITPVKKDAVENDAYYNLQGQQVNKPRHGVYIHEGKIKVVR